MKNYKIKQQLYAAESFDRENSFVHCFCFSLHCCYFCSLFFDSFTKVFQFCFRFLSFYVSLLVVVCFHSQVFRKNAQEIVIKDIKNHDDAVSKPGLEKRMLKQIRADTKHQPKQLHRNNKLSGE